MTDIHHSRAASPPPPPPASPIPSHRSFARARKASGDGSSRQTRGLSVFFSNFNAFGPRAKKGSESRRGEGDEESTDSDVSTGFSPVGSPRSTYTTPPDSVTLSPAHSRFSFSDPPIPGAPVRRKRSLRPKIASIFHLKRSGSKGRGGDSGRSRGGPGDGRGDEAVGSVYSEGAGDQPGTHEQRGESSIKGTGRLDAERAGPVPSDGKSTGLKLERAWKIDPDENPILRANAQRQGGSAGTTESEKGTVVPENKSVDLAPLALATAPDCDINAERAGPCRIPARCAEASVFAEHLDEQELVQMSGDGPLAADGINDAENKTNLNNASLHAKHPEHRPDDLLLDAGPPSSSDNERHPLSRQEDPNSVNAPPLYPAAAQLDIKSTSDCAGAREGGCNRVNYRDLAPGDTSTRTVTEGDTGVEVHTRSGSDVVQGSEDTPAVQPLSNSDTLHTSFSRPSTATSTTTSCNRVQNKNPRLVSVNRTAGMISHHQSSSTGAATPSLPKEFPPYPYAHLYPQQQAQVSSSPRHPFQRAPHSHHGHASSPPQSNPQRKERAMSPPPPSLQPEGPKTNWWSNLKVIPRVLGAKKEKDVSGTVGGTEFVYNHGPDKSAPQGVVFGRPLKESLKYASVSISTADAKGQFFVWGQIPVVVAKCGLFLKENATEVPGTFRINGSARRMRILQELFETPPRYGKNLIWKNEDYTPHDVASVLRRYLTQMPEPVIPHDLYHQFRDALAKEPLNQDEVIVQYKALIRQMPRENQYLLLYVLDLLNVFSRKSDINLMTATNLAVIFRPGLISHPNHEMSPKEHALSQKVLEFLIAQQDWFMLEVPPPPPRRGSQQHSRSSPHSQHPQHNPTRRGSEQHHAFGPSATHNQPSSAAATTGHGFEQQQQHHHHNVSGSANLNAPFASPSLGPHPPAVLHHNSVHAPPLAPPRQTLVSQPQPQTPPQPPTRPSPVSRFGSSSGRPLSESMGSEVDDVMTVPGGLGQGQEENMPRAGSGWKMVAKMFAVEKEKQKDADREKAAAEKERKAMRRRTTVERSDISREKDLVAAASDSASRPVHATNTTNVHATVKRRRTLPSGRHKDKDRDNRGRNGSSDALAPSTLAHATKNADSTAVASHSKDHTNKDTGANASGHGHGHGGNNKKGLLLKKQRRTSPNVSDKERTS